MANRTPVSRPRLTQELVLDLFFMWTLAGLIGVIMGIHIGWWDVLVGMGFLFPGYIPANPRFA